MLVALAVPAAGTPLRAQQWNAPEAVALLASAVQDRAAAAPVQWRAMAHGVVTWFVQVGDTPDDRPRLLTADELRVEVYGRQPVGSKQTITAWRRGRFLPAAQDYHRDHLAVVPEGWPDRIRIGGPNGDEVRDVPHPLAPGADSLYDVALVDSLAVTTPTGSVTLLELAVRPRDARLALVVGTLLIERGTGALVRFQGTFTSAAYRSATIESITFDLQSARAAPGLWLPSRQALEIRRKDRLFDLPIRFAIQTRWTIEPPDLIEGSAPVLEDSMPLIGGLQRPAPDTGWSRPLDQVVDQQLAATQADLDAARSRVADRARVQLLQSGSPVRIGGGALSDFVRINRVQGLTPGAGVTVRLPRGATARPDIGFGTSDSRMVGGLALRSAPGRHQFSLVAERRVRDIADLPTVSTAYNSLSTLVAGADFGDWYRIDRLAAGGQLAGAHLALTGELAVERIQSAVTTFSPFGRAIRPNADLGAGSYRVARVSAQWQSAASAGTRLRLSSTGEWGLGAQDYARATVGVSTWTSLGAGSLHLQASAGVGSSAMPAWRGFALGGRGTLPGEPYRAFGWQRMLLLRGEWLAAVRVPDLRLGGPVSTGPTMHLGPFVAAGWTGGQPPLPGQVTTGGLRPVAGFALEPFWRLLRIEVGTPLRGPGAGHVGLVLDVHPDWWPLL